ncbi:MAG: hypothetical protein Q9227_006974 [Pyrenula ochraceoflavens]
MFSFMSRVLYGQPTMPNNSHHSDRIFVPTCRPQPRSHFSQTRTHISSSNTFIFAHPSPGGLIVLDATLPDFLFLNLSHITPPSARDADQASEDAFAKQLLLAGGKWYASESRWRLLQRAKEDGAILEFEEETEPLPTRKERRWICVGWPSDEKGLWVSEYEQIVYHVEDEDHIVPDDTARLRLCRDMDEKIEVMKVHFQAKWYRSPKECGVFEDLHAWEDSRLEDFQINQE